jgi:hypothetical protein
MAISRRKLLESGAAAIATSSLSRLNLGETIRLPNVVWIVCHDIYAPLLGCYGNRAASTPTINNMAERGVLYRNAFSTAPVCAPSRFALVTGMYPQMCGPAHQMRANGELPNMKPLPIHLRVSSGEENLATEALCFVLNQSAPARRGFIVNTVGKIVGTICICGQIRGHI